MSAALCNGAESAEFKEVSEEEVIALGLKKTNSFKNFKSISEDRFYEVNLYKSDTGSDGPVKLNTERQRGIDL